MIRVFGIPASQLHGEAQKHTNATKCLAEVCVQRGLRWIGLSFATILCYENIQRLMGQKKATRHRRLSSWFISRTISSNTSSNERLEKKPFGFTMVSPVSCPLLKVEDQQKEQPLIYADIALAAFPGSWIFCKRNEIWKYSKRILKTAIRFPVLLAASLQVTNVDDSLIRYWLYGSPRFWFSRPFSPHWDVQKKNPWLLRLPCLDTHPMAFLMVLRMDLKLKIGFTCQSFTLLLVHNFTFKQSSTSISLSMGIVWNCWICFMDLHNMCFVPFQVCILSLVCSHIRNAMHRWLIEANILARFMPRQTNYAFEGKNGWGSQHGNFNVLAKCDYMYVYVYMYIRVYIYIHTYRILRSVSPGSVFIFFDFRSCLWVLLTVSLYCIFIIAPLDTFGSAWDGHVQPWFLNIDVNAHGANWYISRGGCRLIHINSVAFCPMLPPYRYTLNIGTCTQFGSTCWSTKVWSRLSADLNDEASISQLWHCLLAELRWVENILE